MRHIITGNELNKADIEHILSISEKLKAEDSQKSVYADFLKHKNIALIFEKPSLRTRFSFTAGINQLGGHVIESISQTRKYEEPKDFIRVIQNYCSAVIIRASDDNALVEMQQYSNVPIINALTDMFHPCQALADLLTLKECFKNFENIKIAYIGDENNVLHSLMMMASKLGITVHYCCPKGCEPQQNYPLTKAFSDPKEAVKNCHAVYTDVWTSMGFEQKDESLFEGLQVNEALMSHALPDAVFMHCMPMERGKEVSQHLPDSECSVIFQQSENRLHVQKALLISLLS